MRYSLFPILLSLITCLSLKAQEVNFSTTASPAARAEIRQDYMAGHIDGILLNRPSSAEVILDLHPNFYSQGYRLLEEGKLEEAKQAFETFLGLSPENGLAYFGLGDYYFITQDYHRATYYYQRAAALGVQQALSKTKTSQIAQTYYEIEEQKAGW